jgi:hypothetical protein
VLLTTTFSPPSLPLIGFTTPSMIFGIWKMWVPSWIS